MVWPALVGAVLAAAAPFASEMTAVAALPGEPHMVSAAGLSADEAAILTLENPSAFDPAVVARRLVLVGANDQATADAVVAVVRWLKTLAPKAIRDRWMASALPLPRFRAEDTQSLTRWLIFQAPDLVVQVGGDAVQLEGVRVERIAVDGATAALQKLLSADIGASGAHETILARIRRDPLDIARLLATRYPETPSISYIPAVSWVNTLQLAAATGDASLRARVIEQVRPWLSEGRKLFGDRIQLTAVAGTIVFADLAASENAAVALAEEGARLASAEKSPGVASYGGGWTDDMFMATTVLARTGLRPGRAQDFDVAARLLTAYAARLQRDDGLFNHASDGPAAWGRGNGFAAMGLTEALTALPANHPQRAAILAIYRRQMAAALKQQAPDGMWREVIDEPGAYREETATAMLMTAMARGIRLGWIDRSFAPAVERAWRALAAHVRDDGTIVDVCASTGSGPTRKYYLDRPALTGADDRGGAMALLASMERATRPSSRPRAARSSAGRSVRSVR
jgi:unsaturated rhamnogalacturonyl hydrolase